MNNNPKFVNAKDLKDNKLDDEVINFLISLSINSRTLAKRMIMRSLENERKRGSYYEQI